MSEDLSQNKTGRARPLTGAILGILIGLAVAVILQQQGVWPLDRITVFLLPGVIGLIGMILTRLGREGATTTFVISLVILIPMTVWGALGFSEVNETGQLNGGCEVVAESSVDGTTVTDTSRSDPFVIDPDGGLTWVASSPTVFDDYPWEIHVDIGGVPVVLDSEESQDNDGGSQANTGDVSEIRSYASDRGIDVDQLVGVYEVGGFAATCDGFGFVRILGDGLSTASLAALIIAIILLVILIIVTVTGRGRTVDVEVETVTTSPPPQGRHEDGPAQHPEGDDPS